MQKAPRARTNAGNIVTRLCARVKHSVLFRISKTLCRFGNQSEPVAVADWISNSIWVIMHVLYHGQYRKPRVCEHAQVTMVARLCARVEHSVLFRIGKFPCWLRSPNEPLAVAGRISRLTSVLVYVTYYGQYRKPRVHERARVTMVTRLCAHVEQSLLFRAEQSLCSLGSPREPLAVTHWIFKLTIVTRLCGRRAVCIVCSE